jgi:hypothetical protein
VTRQGHLYIVKLLLSDKRVNPSAESNGAIREACREGHSEIAKLLLSDKQVDPSDENDATMLHACFNHCLDCCCPTSGSIPLLLGRSNTVKMLLNDRRVEPSAANNEATPT